MSIVRRLFHRLLVAVGAVSLTLVFFLVLPLMQTISKAPADMTIRTVTTTNVPPPPTVKEEEPPPEEKPVDKPPELTEAAPPLSLSQLELALNPGVSDGLVGGDFAVKLNTVAAAGGGVDALFNMADLDQKPRVVYQPGPTLDARLRGRGGGTVYIIFIVDQRGRVESPIVQKSSDPAFDAAALAAVKQWKFEPGKRNGQPVRFRMRVPVTFPKG